MARPKPLEDSSVFSIKVPVNLRAEFTQACAEQDVTASQVIRAVMREFVAKHQKNSKATSDGHN